MIVYTALRGLGTGTRDELEVKTGCRWSSLTARIWELLGNGGYKRQIEEVWCDGYMVTRATRRGRQAVVLRCVPTSDGAA